MDPKFDSANKDRLELDRQWVSYRGQTLARTGQKLINVITSEHCFMCILTFLFLSSGVVESPVRGMMYYRETLELQCFLDFADDNG